jgi:nucleotide-binding universal stress UspA family protein
MRRGTGGRSVDTVPEIAEAPRSPTRPPLPFRSILCGVDGSRSAAEAARQAAVLAGSDCRLVLVGAYWAVGRGHAAQASISPGRLEQALDRSYREACDLGAHPELQIAHDRDDTRALLTYAAEHDLLVVGTHGGSRVGAILVGGTAAEAAHASPVPVLVARPAPGPDPFPHSILLAIDGGPHAVAARDAAVAIARRHAARVAIAAPPRCSPAVAEAGALVRAATGVDPVLFEVQGSPAPGIAAAARDAGASLVVMGSRALHGLAAVKSVSERTVAAAPCSVLVMRRNAAPASAPRAH